MNKLELICMMATKIFVKKLESCKTDYAIQESVRLANEIYHEAVYGENDPTSGAPDPTEGTSQKIREDLSSFGYVMHSGFWPFRKEMHYKDGKLIKTIWNNNMGPSSPTGAGETGFWDVVGITMMIVLGILTYVGVRYHKYVQTHKSTE